MSINLGSVVNKNFPVLVNIPNNIPAPIPAGDGGFFSPKNPGLSEKMAPLRDSSYFTAFNRSPIRKFMQLSLQKIEQTAKKPWRWVIQAVTWLDSPIVGGHQQPLKGLQFHHPKKGHGFFITSELGISMGEPTNPWCSVGKCFFSWEFRVKQLV